MMSKHRPKKGSRGYVRTRSHRKIPSLRYHRVDAAIDSSIGLTEIVGVKVGMTHVSETRQVPINPTSKVTRPHPFCLPATIIEFPLMRVLGCRIYHVVDDHLVAWKNFSKDEVLPELKPDAQLRILIELDLKQLRALPTKKNRKVELGVQGSILEQRNFYQELPEFIDPYQFAKIGSFFDVTGITKGHGFAGVVKRMGVKLLSHKNSKHRRAIGNLGPRRPGHIRSTVPRAGQLGVFQRTTFNNRLLLVSDDSSKVTPAGGFQNYGFLTGTYGLLEGSIPSARKGIVFLRRALRPSRHPTLFKSENIDYISQTSKQ